MLTHCWSPAAVLRRLVANSAEHHHGIVSSLNSSLVKCATPAFQSTAGCRDCLLHALEAGLSTVCGLVASLVLTAITKCQVSALSCYFVMYIRLCVSRRRRGRRPTSACGSRWWASSSASSPPSWRKGSAGELRPWSSRCSAGSWRANLSCGLNLPQTAWQPLLNGTAAAATIGPSISAWPLHRQTAQTRSAQWWLL